jgi:hypothetical protein
MIPYNQQFGEYDVASIDELVENFTQYTWTLCTAFALQDLIFFNDSFSEDGAQEYAVVRAGQQIESITVSWMSWGLLRAGAADVDHASGARPVQRRVSYVPRRWLNASQA